MGIKRRAIGFAGDTEDEYAIYPDKEAGHEALVVMLRGSVYSPMTLRAALQYYEPKKKNYIDIVARRTGLSPERTIKSLDNHEFESFWEAIEFVDEWTEGEEELIEKWIISGVHKKNGVIFECLVQDPRGSFWLRKEDAISLVNEGGLHAIIVHLKNGTCYLRPEHGAKPFELII
jgi:hypothetical protein